MNIPGESAEYRKARAALLQAEANLRAEVENVAALRRALPEGAAPAAAYSFKGIDGKNSALEDLFGEKPSLFIYSFMFEPAAGQGPCPMCCAFLDSLNGAAPHIADRTAIAVIAKASAKELSELVADRDWSNLPMYSSAGSSFNTDYNAESADGEQLPMAHTWKMGPEGPRHFWSSEMFHHQSDWRHHPRHMDMMWPLWNVLDVTPEGRGEAWFPQLSYGS